MESTDEIMNENGNVNAREKEDTMGILNKFCWPGFIMPQFWGIGNDLKIGLIAFIPILFPFIAIRFGINGYRMAYDESSRDKVKFYDKQLKWRKATLIYVVVLVSAFLLSKLEGTINYISNKNELNRIVKEYEEKKAQTVQNMETLLSEQYLKMYIGDVDYNPIGDLEVCENGEIWSLRNGYDRKNLSTRFIKFGKPAMLSAYQFFSIGDGWRVEVMFTLNEEFQIVESKYYVCTPEEIHLRSGGEDALYLDKDRLEQYMDFETMEEILER